MNHKKPTPILPQARHKTCPICGHSSYSPNGIHPQCAVSQADEPRRARLAAARKAEADKAAAGK